VNKTESFSAEGKIIWPALILIGISAGFLSGLFGVGGGVIIIPALVIFCGFGMKMASGTSLSAILIASGVGVISYQLQGQVDYLIALIVLIGSIPGAQIGAIIMKKLHGRTVTILFLCLLALIIAGLIFTPVSREGFISLDWVNGTALVLLGFLVGIVAGLVGLGGGILIVPALMLIFGMGDLLAKGTSLFIMLPTAISGTIRNLINKNVSLKAGAIVGVSAAAMVPLGAWSANLLNPTIAAWLFATLLVAIAVRLYMQEIRKYPR